MSNALSMIGCAYKYLEIVTDVMVWIGMNQMYDNYFINKKIDLKTRLADQETIDHDWIWLFKLEEYDGLSSLDRSDSKACTESLYGRK